ncbi:hypothetical protein BOTBODRAFT_28606 [Botryobasidium botryosum FD-172 SS1]|uniref:Large ribosomal subunit protein uL23m n=1 Tax=Botryobasidium botryosum (strain FD-172 SS1) TaxID=930990 RepID=A0A067MWN2_BOTB1|nr:hypothetical protein BOTBODRAFT_28606 [Botryobasidium botryosum FD-172 SS1]
MSRLFRRFFSEFPGRETLIKEARDASRPLRLKEKVQTPDPNGLTASQKTKLRHALKMNGATRTDDMGRPKPNQKNIPLRGVRRILTPDGKYIDKVVGQRIYLPNIIFRMMRNATPTGKAYNPYEATFRVPPSLTKMDIRSYLSAVYGVATTYIRTDNYISPVRRLPLSAHKARNDTSRTYKRAVVGLVKPFYHPDLYEDLDKKQREDRETSLNDMFYLDQVKEMRRVQLGERMNMREGWSKRGTEGTNRRKIARSASLRRAEREGLVEKAVKDMIASGAPLLQPSSSSSGADGKTGEKVEESQP